MSKSDHSRFHSPFLAFGTNAISAYVFSELLQSTLTSIHPRQGINLQQVLYRSIAHVVPNQAVASLLYSIGFVAVCWVPVSALYRRSIFLKI